jgi:1,5-anhydro-D-fructose reductase (1,5-anhydro-D-mannitol-forming)
LTDRPVGWAFVGAGRHARLWLAPALVGANGARAVGVWSRDPERGAEFAATYGVERSYASLAEALADPDIEVVLISTPNSLHAAHALAALGAGKHVLVEKPMAMSVAEGQQMLDACRLARVVLMVGHHHRFRRNPLAVKLLLERGRIGRVDMVAMVQTEPDQTTWLTKPENGGYLLGSGVHGLDLLRWWLGDVARVAALTGQYRDERVENGSLLLLDFVSGAHASFQDSVIPGSVPPPGSGVVRFDAVLTGEHGVIHADMYGEVRVSTPTGWEVQTTLPTWGGHYDFLRMEAYANQASEFVAAIREHRPPRVPPEDAMAAVAIVEAAHRAAAEGAWVSVAPAGAA